MGRRVLLACVLVVFSGSLTSCVDSPMAPYPVSEPVEAMDAAFGPGDLFDVRVFGETELSATYTVDADGTISFPLLNRIMVQGKTPAEVEKEITTGLADGFIKNPQVTVTPREYRSKKITVVGMVKQPGTFQYTENMTIVEAISRAGGFVPLSRKNAVKVTRKVNGKSFTVAVDDINRGKAPNFLLRPGDEIYVPERPI
jgi:polysaccharide export outer membrane protein